MSDSASSPDSSPGSENAPPPSPPNDTDKPPIDTHEPSPNPPSSESPRSDPKYSPPSPPSNEPPSSNTPPSSDPTPPESSPTIPPPEDSSRPGNSHSPPPPMGSSHSPPPPLGSSHSPPSPPNSPSSQLPPPPNSPVDPPPGKQPPSSPPSSTPSNNSPPSSTPTTSSPTPTTPVFPSPLQPIESPPLLPPEQALPLPPPGSLSPPSVETSPVSTTPNTSPSTDLTPGTPSLSSPPPPQTRGPPKSTPNHSSSMTSTTDGSSRSSDSSGIMVGVAFAGVLAITLVTFVFVFLAKRKRRSDVIPEHFKPMPPSNYSGKSDGNYYGPTPGFGNFGQSDLYYLNPPPAPPTGGHSHGSNRGYGYQSGQPESGALGNSKSWFTYEELFDITNGFSQQNILGEGGFGCVYKGRLLDGREVAVKQLKAGSGQGEREFRAEVEIISRVHHRHLVSLVGYCIAEHHRLLVYEFLPNNTLEYHLHGKGIATMELQNRLKIAIGAAKGLAYLHEDCHPHIIHRDIKSANILLDNSFEAQVADFGLAKLTEENYTHVSTRVMGTFGYMAPEYASSGKLTDRSDVFSFGVVLLELVTGRKSVDTSQPLGDESLVEWARPLLSSALETGNLKQIVDPRLEQNYVESEMLRMIEAAAACVRHSAPKRPRMAQVVRALDSEGGLSDISNGVKPGQSVVFNSGQYSADIQKFRQMAFGSNGSSGDFSVMGEYDQRSAPYSGEHHSREHHHKP